MYSVGEATRRCFLDRADLPDIRPLKPLRQVVGELLAGRSRSAPRLDPGGQIVAVVREVAAIWQFGVGQAFDPVGAGRQQNHVVKKGRGLVTPFEAFVQPAGHHTFLKMRIQNQARTRHRQRPVFSIILLVAQSPLA